MEKARVLSHTYRHLGTDGQSRHRLTSAASSLAAINKQKKVRRLIKSTITAPNCRVLQSAVEEGPGTVSL